MDVIPTIRRSRLLIIEDDESLSEILGFVFKEKRYELKFVRFTDDIIDLIESFEPDLIIMDYILPKNNGGELCSEVKKNAKWGHIPVIIYSAYSRVLLSLGDYGCDLFVEKPFDLDELGVQVSEQLMQHSPNGMDRTTTFPFRRITRVRRKA